MKYWYVGKNKFNDRWKEEIQGGNGRDKRNKGITSEALAVVIRFLFDEVDMHRIMTKHDVDNPASGEVMKKCGIC